MTRLDKGDWVEVVAPDYALCGARGEITQVFGDLGDGATYGVVFYYDGGSDLKQSVVALPELALEWVAPCGHRDSGDCDVRCSPTFRG